jgi:hypothetical protein
MTTPQTLDKPRQHNYESCSCPDCSKLRVKTGFGGLIYDRACHSIYSLYDYHGARGLPSPRSQGNLNFESLPQTEKVQGMFKFDPVWFTIKL